LTLAPAASAASIPRLSKSRAESLFVQDRTVASWLARYPTAARATSAVFDRASDAWVVFVSTHRAGIVADGDVSDKAGAVTKAWTGPQVVWPMARGYTGLFGGRWINLWPVWLAFCAVFLLGLADLRRPLSLRNLDLVVLLSFSASLVYFNRGHIFASVSLIYPPLVYLLLRCAWIGYRGRPPRASRPVWPVWLLAAATIVLVAGRITMNVENSNVIDVGYSSVVGAQRIAAGQSPYGHFPASSGLPCGRPDADGNVLGQIQADGSCQVPVVGGDTYGPVAYEAYLPAFWALGNRGWSWARTGKGGWSDLPAAHITAIFFDLVCLLLLGLLGLRLGGRRLAITLAFSWAAFPFTAYVLSSDSNDALPPAFLLVGLILVAFPWGRAVSLALSAWTKFGSLLLLPLWASYSDGRKRPREKVVFTLAFLLASYSVFAILLFEPRHLHAFAAFYRRSIGYQLGRDSPFSIWDWRQYHAGLPDLHLLQRVLEVAVVAVAAACYFMPRRKSAFQLVALTGFLLIAFELVLTHWFYLYIAWFFPFVAVALLSSSEEMTVATSFDEREPMLARRIVRAGASRQLPR
jgi:hypothetical protein